MPGKIVEEGKSSHSNAFRGCSFQISESSSYRRRRQINSCSDGIHKKLVGLTIGLDRSYGVEDGTQGSIAHEAQRRYDWGKLRGLYPMPGSCEKSRKTKSSTDTSLRCSYLWRRRQWRSEGGVLVEETEERGNCAVKASRHRSRTRSIERLSTRVGTINHGQVGGHAELSEGD